ncbi:hypothetical protein chiPu_0019364 [Chiloscyllium punctatum]|uniref:Cystatin domain-containing protein n=1 Tax=Chiloscyllium punctatum TaxID=137246 RepID=A0A401RRN5_CHIPU|nr:hypothetical protein [Chiloscyllium punctatum]
MAAIWIGVCALLSAAFFTSTSAMNDEEDLLGQRFDVNVTNIYIQKAAALIKKGPLSSHQKFTVVKAQQQAVGGLMLYLTITAELEKQKTTCEATVFSRPWLEEMTVERFVCESSKQLMI